MKKRYLYFIPILLLFGGCDEIVGSDCVKPTGKECYKTNAPYGGIGTTYEWVTPEYGEKYCYGVAPCEECNK